MTTLSIAIVKLADAHGQASSDTVFFDRHCQNTILKPWLNSVNNSLIPYDGNLVDDLTICIHNTVATAKLQ